MNPSESAQWLEEHLQTLDLPEDAEGYLLGRGATSETIEKLELREWRAASRPCPSPIFKERGYGNRGQNLEGGITIPIRSASGRILGVEIRSRFQKKISEFRVPEAAWNPFLINTQEAARKMWEGGSVWITEGLFDLLPLTWVVPETDAVIATLKAGLARDHVVFLSRFCRGTIYMVYDNDETGRLATVGGIHAKTGKHLRGALELLRAEGLKVVDYRYGGKDPGEVWRSGGRQKLQQMFQQR